MRGSGCGCVAVYLFSCVSVCVYVRLLYAQASAQTVRASSTSELRAPLQARDDLVCERARDREALVSLQARCSAEAQISSRVESEMGVMRHALAQQRSEMESRVAEVVQKSEQAKIGGLEMLSQARSAVGGGGG
eukprot:6211733-Pleurochrysis_carterae.AAC.2